MCSPSLREASAWVVVWAEALVSCMLHPGTPVLVGCAIVSFVLVAGVLHDFWGFVGNISVDIACYHP